MDVRYSSANIKPRRFVEAYFGQSALKRRADARKILTSWTDEIFSELDGFSRRCARTIGAALVKR